VVFRHRVWDPVISQPSASTADAGKSPSTHRPDLNSKIMPGQQFDEHIAIIARRVFMFVGSARSGGLPIFMRANLIYPCQIDFDLLLRGVSLAYNASSCAWSG